MGSDIVDAVMYNTKIQREFEKQLKKPKNKSNNIGRPHRLMTITVMIFGQPYYALIDGGASHSIINNECVKNNKNLNSLCSKKPVARVSGFDSKAAAHQSHRVPDVNISIRGKVITQSLLTAPIKGYDIILGHDFLVERDAINSYAHNALSFVDATGERVTFECNLDTEVTEKIHFLSASIGVNQLLSDPRVLRPAAPAESLDIKDEAVFRVWVKEVDSEFIPSNSQSTFTHSEKNLLCTT